MAQCSRRLRAAPAGRRGAPRGDIPDGRGRAVIAHDAPHGSRPAAGPTGRLDHRPGLPARHRRRPRPGRARSTTCAAAGTTACSAASRRGSRATYGWDVDARPARVRRGRDARDRCPRLRRRVDRDPARPRRRDRTRTARDAAHSSGSSCSASACSGSAVGWCRAAATSSASRGRSRSSPAGRRPRHALGIEPDTSTAKTRATAAPSAG